MTHTVVVRFRDGMEIRNIPEVDVVIDMLQTGSPFAFTLWRSKLESADWTAVQRRALCGSLVSVAIDGATQLLGRIEDIDVGADADGGATLSISGRDVAARLIDWDADPRVQLRNVTLQEAVAKLVEPFGVAVNVCSAAAEREVRGIPGRRTRRVSTGRPSRRKVQDRTRPQIGERVFQAIDRLCRAEGYMVWIAPAASGSTIELVIDKPLDPSTTEPPFAFVREQSTDDWTWRGNILSAHHRVSTRNVPTEVTAFGHTRLASGEDARLQRTVFNERMRDSRVVDPTLFGVQPRFVQTRHSHTQDGLNAEAERLFAEAMRDFRSYTANVRGFGQNNKLYTTNTGARVRDEIPVPTLDEDMLITRVHFHEDQSRGQVSELLMYPRGAIAVTPLE